MKKAQFKYKYCGWGYDSSSIYLVYEYRGNEYTVHENRASGNAMGDELWQQHKREQEYIDRLIEHENASKTNEEIPYEETVDYALDKFFKFIG